MAGKKKPTTFRASCDASIKDDEVIISMSVVSPKGKLVYQSTSKQTFKCGSTRGEVMAIRDLLKNLIRLRI